MDENGVIRIEGEPGCVDCRSSLPLGRPSARFSRYMEDDLTVPRKPSAHSLLDSLSILCKPIKKTILTLNENN